MVGTSPHGSPWYWTGIQQRWMGTSHAQDAVERQHTHQAFPSSPQQGERDHTEVLASSDQAGLQESLANAGVSSHIGGLVLRGGYCSRLLRLFAL